jgi:hypothetical protein
LNFKPDTFNETLAVALGEASCGIAKSIVEIASALTANQGRGVLLIDTLDLVLTERIVPTLRHILIQLIDVGTTVVFTCRDHEYDAFLEPKREKLSGLAEAVDRYTVPEFSAQEVKEAALAFIKNNQKSNLPDKGQTFISTILALSADNRSLHEITHNPLLLALLCDLFGKDGFVPRDLTVSKLYEEYWEEKIIKSRRYGRHSPEALAKEKLCMDIARNLLEVSDERLYESVYETDLGLALNSVMVAARAELLSEGVLRIPSSGRLRFFHQTFLEYAIARWLATRSGTTHLSELLVTLNGLGTDHSRLHWWPVIRQLFTIVNKDEFDGLLLQLNANLLAAFRALALAAASRSEPSALRKLLPIALETGEEHQKILLFAVESTPIPLAEAAWDIALTLLRRGDQRTAVAAAGTAGALLARWGNLIGYRFDAAFDAIEQRILQEKKGEGDTDENSSFIGPLLAAPLATLARGADLGTLRTLRNHYFSYGDATRSAVLRLHLSPGVPDETQRALLQIVLAEPITDRLRGEMTLLLERLLPGLVSPGDSALWTSWNDALHAVVPEGWGVVLSRAIGRCLAANSYLLAAILQDLFTSDTTLTFRDRNLLAIQEAMRNGAVEVISSALLTIPIASISPSLLRPLGVLVQQIAYTSNLPQREALAKWIEPVVRKYPDELGAAFIGLAEGSLSAYLLLVQLVTQLPPQRRAKHLMKILRTAPEQTIIALRSDIEAQLLSDPRDRTSKVAMVELYRILAKNSVDMVTELVNMSLASSKKVAVAAAQALATLAGAYERPSTVELLPLAKSKFVGVRVSWLEALVRIVERGLPITAQELTIVCAALEHETADPVIQRMCNVVIRWIRANESVPLILAETVAGMSLRLLEKGEIDGGTARSLIVLFKIIAQTEEQALRLRLGEWVRPFLRLLDLRKVRDGESEAISLLSAVARGDVTFLSSAIEDCPSLQFRNVRAVTLAIKRVEGAGSPLLDRIMESTWCTAEVKSLIFKLRGV